MKSEIALWLSAKTNYDIPPPKHSHHRKHEHEREMILMKQTDVLLYIMIFLYPFT